MTPITLQEVTIDHRSFDWHKFWKKAAIKLAYRAIEIATLIPVGLALGLHLVRY